MAITTAQALMKAEQLEVDGCITPLAMSLIKLAHDFRDLVGVEAYEKIIENNEDSSYHV